MIFPNSYPEGLDSKGLKIERCGTGLVSESQPEFM